MEHELEEMHEGFDQAMRAAMQGFGSLRDRKARSDQVKADQARVAAASDRRQFEAYQQAQDAMLRSQLGNVASPTWWERTSPQDIAATRDLAERYADVSPYAQASLHHMDEESARRGVDLATSVEAAGPDVAKDRTATEEAFLAGPAVDADGRTLADALSDYHVESRGHAALHREAKYGDDPTIGPDPQWGPGAPRWDEQDSLYEHNLNELEHRIDAFGPEGRDRFNEYLMADTDHKHELAAEYSAARAQDRTVRADGAQDREEAAEHTTTGTAETPTYERSRASDMPDVDPQLVQTRKAIAGSFPHPIRTYTANGAKGGSRQAGGAPGRRHQLKRGK